MGVGPFAYMPFILVFLKFNDAAWDTRLSVHKTMGVLSYIYLVINQFMGGTFWFFDVPFFLFVTYFFYGAMSDGFDHQSVPGIVTVVVAGVLYGWMAWPEPPAPNDGKQAVTHSGAESPTEKELRKALETAQKAMQGQQAPAELLK